MITKNIKINLKKEKGITLIALVITIIVLLILAGVSITMLTGDNGILTQVGRTKIETALGTVKEQLRIYQEEKRFDEKELTPETLLAEGKVSRTIQKGENDKYYMYYALKEKSFEGMQGLGKGNLTNLKDIFLIDDDLNVKYIASNGKEYGDNINNKILEDETEIRFSNKAFSEYISKISGISEEKMKFKWMKNQTNLSISDSEIDSLQDLIFFPNLEKLSLENMTLYNLEGIENCIKIQKFYTTSTEIKDYRKLSKLPVLNVFSVLYGKNVNLNNVIDSLKTAKNLEYFSINVTPLETKSMKKIGELSNNLKSIYLRATNNIEKIEGLENKINLIELNLQGNKISNIEGLEKCTKLKHLNLEDNKISKIDNIENLENLTELILGRNQLVDILNADKNINLIKLDLTKNPNIKSNRNEYKKEEIERLDKIQEIITVRNGKIYINPEQLKLFKGYKYLNLGNSDISTLECLEGQTELESLSLYMCKNITLADQKSQEILKEMKKLKELELTGSNVENISAINELRNLTSLQLSYQKKNDLSKIEDIISNLTVLKVSTESLKTITNCNVNKITKLNLPNSNLSELPDITKFSELIEINLKNNPQISNFEILELCSSLKKLVLSYNDLHGKIISFYELTNLTNLDLSNNTLWSEDLENLKALKNNTNLTINLSNNAIIDATALLELNPNTKINLTGNINLSQESKDKLKSRFANNVTF